MKLPSPRFIKKQAEHAYYLSLLLRDEKVTAVIFAKEDDKIRAVSSHEAYFQTSIEHAEIEELLDIFDKAVSIAESKLEKGVPQVEKTIFAVKETWIENEKIKKEYLAKLKKVCDELSLEPIGFLVFSEATAHLLEKQEGAPVSAIFVEVGKQLVTISLLKASKVVATKTAPIETFTITHIVDSLLRHFPDFDVLPTKLIVQNDTAKTEKENKELEHEFTSHVWSKHLPFLHTPEIVMLPIHFETQTVLFGAATQMGLTVADEILHPEVVTGTAKEEEHAEETEKPIEHDASPDIPLEGENFGFVEDTDIALSRRKDEVEESEDDTEEETASTRDQHDNVLAAVEEEEIAKNESQGLPTQAFMLGGVMRSFFTKLPLKLPSFGGKVALRGSKLVFALPLVVVLLIGLAIAYVMMIKTTVSIAIRPDTKSINQDVTFTTNGKSDFDSNVLAAQTVSADESGSGTAQATGKKDVGDKAKGAITIYNGTDQSKKYSAGTTVTSANGLKFTIDKDVSIASASGDVISGTKSGSADVAVTASDIGTKYNLPSQTEFSVSGEATSDVKAKNGSAFSGGTQKTVTVVSQADVDKATKQLMSAIAGKAKQALSSKLSGNQALLSDFSGSSIAKKSLDHQVGSQASNVTITGKVTYQAVAYDKTELTNYGQQLLQHRGNGNQTLDTSSITATIDKSKTNKSGDTTATLIIKGNFLPKIDQDTLTKNITGKSFTDATKVISSLPQVSNVTFTLSPNLPFLPKRVSMQTHNISVITHNE